MRICARARSCGGERMFFWQSTYSAHTNGVIQSANEVLDDVVSIAAGFSEGLALKSDTTVIAFGQNRYEVPIGLSNVFSIAFEGNSCWAIKRDGTVTRWGNDEDEANLVSGLSNITGIAWAGYRSYLALTKQGTVLGFRLGGGGSHTDSVAGPAVRPIKVRGQVLSNVVGLASSGYTPLVIKHDGRVFRLGFQKLGEPPVEPKVTKIDESTIAIDMGGESWKTPLRVYFSGSGGDRWTCFEQCSGACLHPVRGWVGAQARRHGRRLGWGASWRAAPCLPG